MIKGRDELDLSGTKHAVAEDVSAHVSDPYDGERLGLDVLPPLSEVPLNALPGTLRP